MLNFPVILSFLFLLFLPLYPLAQKIEVERQLPKKMVPAKAIEFLNQEYPGRTNVLYYQEKNEEGRFLEIKFKFGGYRYSVKFLPDGQLYDTERVIQFKELPDETKSTITQELGHRLQRFRVVRVQEQLRDGALTGYEIEIRSNSSGYLGYFEVHMDTGGHFISIRRIREAPNDYLFF